MSLPSQGEEWTTETSQPRNAGAPTAVKWVFRVENVALKFENGHFSNLSPDTRIQHMRLEF